MLLKQSPLANLSSINMNNNVLMIDGDLSAHMISVILNDLSHSPHITCVYLLDNISVESMKLILNKIVSIKNISDICFGHDDQIEKFTLAMNILNQSESSMVVWAHSNNIVKKISNSSYSSLVS